MEVGTMKKEIFTSMFVLMTVLSVSFSAVTNAEELNCVNVKSKVLEAVKIYEEKGDASFPVFTDPSSGMLFGEQMKTKDGKVAYSGFIFIINENKVMLMHANNPKLNGIDFSGKKDKRGKLFADDMIKLAIENPDGGWYTYYWPKKPGGKPHKKTSFLRVAKHNGKTVIVGCGLFDVTASECNR